MEQATRTLTRLQIESSVANHDIDGAFGVGDWPNNLMKRHLHDDVTTLNNM
jgi:hypothetical protein